MIETGTCIENKLLGPKIRASNTHTIAFIISGALKGIFLPVLFLRAVLFLDWANISYVSRYGASMWLVLRLRGTRGFRWSWFWIILNCVLRFVHLLICIKLLNDILTFLNLHHHTPHYKQRHESLWSIWTLTIQIIF